MFSCWPSLEPLAKTLPLKRSQNIFYYDYGVQNNSNKPVLILVHGLADEADTWRHIIRPLGDAGYRVLAPDLPGFGRSATNKRSSVARHRDAVLTLANAVSENTENGFVLIGSSMGATIAEAAALADNRIKAIVQIDGCMPMGGTGSPQILLSALPFYGSKRYRSFRVYQERAWLSLIAYYADLHALNEEDKNFLRSRVMDRVNSVTQERAYLTSLRSMIFQTLRTSYYRRIGSWPGEIALIWGEKDNVMPIIAAQSFIKLRGNNKTELSIINGAGHLPHQERPAETADAILQFVGKLTK